MSDRDLILETAYSVVAGHGSATGLVRLSSDRAELTRARAGHGFPLLHEFIRLPSTGGGDALLSLRAPSFADALSDLPISRARWRFARWTLAQAAKMGIHRHIGLPRAGVLCRAAGARSAPDISLLSGVRDEAQKTIVRQHGGKEADDVIWKIGRRGPGANAVRAEGNALRWLETHSASAQFGPQLLGEGEDTGAAWIKMSALKGSRPGRRLTAAGLDFVARLGALEAKSASTSPDAWMARVRDRLLELPAELAPATEKASGAPAAGLRARLLSALREVEEVLQDAPLAFRPAHGDFTPWNTRHHNGALRAFDWELFNPMAPPWFDQIHWAVQVAILVQHQPAGDLYADLLLSLSKWGADPRRASLALAMYVIEVSSRDRERARSKAPRIQQHDWLRQVRSHLLDRAMEALIS